MSKGLDPEELCDIYEEMFAQYKADPCLETLPSLAKVVKVITEKGYFSPRTGKPYTRQNVWLTMKKIARGVRLLKKNPFSKPRADLKHA